MLLVCWGFSWAFGLFFGLSLHLSRLSEDEQTNQHPPRRLRACWEPNKARCHFKIGAERSEAAVAMTSLIRGVKSDKPADCLFSFPLRLLRQSETL